DSAAGRADGSGKAKRAYGGDAGGDPTGAGDDGGVVGGMHAADGRVDGDYVYAERPAAAEAVGSRRYGGGVRSRSGVFSGFRDGAGARAGVCGGRLRSSANGGGHQ